MSYDKRKGWRGPLTNIIILRTGLKQVDKFKLENSINWKISIVKKVDQFSVEIETEDKVEGKLNIRIFLGQKKNLMNC